VLELETIYEEHFSAILNFVVRRVRNVALAEDITAGVFMKVVEKLHTYNPVKASIQTWLFSIASHELINYYRRNKLEVDIEQYDSLLKSPDIVEEIDKKQREFDKDMQYRTLMETCDTALSPEEKNIVLLFYLEEKSYAEIATITGIKEVTLRSKLHRALKKIKDAFPTEVNYE